MDETGMPDRYDEEIIESFQVEMAEKIKKGGSEDLKFIDVNQLGKNEMQAFGLLKGLNDRQITLKMFRDEISRYEGIVQMSEKRLISLTHYFAWLRNQAMKNLEKKQ